MNRWQTEVSIQKPPFLINTNSSFYFIGSCFSEHIQKNLTQNLFDVNGSPFGIEYNPISISQNLKRILNQNLFDKEEIIQTSNGYSTWHHHSKYNHSNDQEFIKENNQNLKMALQKMTHADFLCITLGTAFCYYLKDSQTPVNNCHKMPPSLFSRKPSSVLEIANQLASCLDKIISINPKIKFIFTLSPVKHLRDNPTENSYSKALCRCAIEELILKFNNNSFYFPAYEILNDELRDYRFYDSDMMHPSKQTTQYIAEKFLETMLDHQSKEFIKEWAPIQKFLEHNPDNPLSPSYQNALTSINNKILTLKSKFPQLHWNNFKPKF